LSNLYSIQQQHGEGKRRGSGDICGEAMMVYI
jgi:hypothetical protein